MDWKILPMCGWVCGERGDRGERQTYQHSRSMSKMFVIVWGPAAQSLSGAGKPWSKVSREQAYSGGLACLLALQSPRLVNVIKRSIHCRSMFGLAKEMEGNRARRVDHAQRQLKHCIVTRIVIAFIHFVAVG